MTCGDFTGAISYNADSGQLPDGRRAAQTGHWRMQASFSFLFARAECAPARSAISALPVSLT
jgi:hypothetical protein